MSMKPNNPNFAKAWTEEELAIVQEMFATATVAEMMQRLPRHSWTGIRAKGKRLGLIRDRSKDSHGCPVAVWSEEEDMRLRRLYRPGDGVKYLARAFPRRTEKALLLRVNQLKLSGFQVDAEQHETADRSVAQMREHAERRAQAIQDGAILPELQELFRAERSALQVLETIQHAQARRKRFDAFKRPTINLSMLHV